MMRGLPVKTQILTLIVILSNVLGNLALSLGMKSQAAAAAVPAYLVYVRAFLNPLVIAGVTLLTVWMLSRMALMSWADLSYVLPVTSLGYVLTAAMGKFFLAESISGRRWIGTFLIVAGTLLVSFTVPKTQRQPV
ncbi:MAG TPA: hypothetical protein VMZ52_14245 [Bryobacteraceae bacterium]|nr:hypothetical protein [Bryobacteraceae bacterium]